MELLSFLLAALFCVQGDAWARRSRDLHGPLVTLDYASYEGQTTSDGIKRWLGMRFAAAPVSELRFAAPQDPPRATEIQRADEHGPKCLATNSTDDSTSEDCLFLDVYAPSSATPGSKLPVYVFIQGGGFNSNANANYNGRGLIKASRDNIVVVTFNYRVGPYGFLASTEVEEQASLNNGLKDQIKALQWVQKYISNFGGDPGHVVVGGASAGAASISLLLSAYGGRDDGLFHAAAAESVSFANVYTVAESEFMYTALLERTDCADLACLRDLTTDELQSQNVNIPLPGGAHPPLYMYDPVIDGDLLREVTYDAFANGRVVRVPTIAGADVNDGTVFVPRDTDSVAASNQFLVDQFPALTTTHLNVIDYLYPVEGQPQFPGTGRYWRQGSAAYGDLRYACPSLFVSSAYAGLAAGATVGDASPTTWHYVYNVSDPDAVAAGLGVPHTVEVNAIWGPENVNGAAPPSYTASNAHIVPLMQGYWTSFVRAFDPNTHRAEGAPRWEEFAHGAPRRLAIRTNHTRMAEVEGVMWERCGYFAGIGPSIRQ